jgi:hypothetical protein
MLCERKPLFALIGVAVFLVPILVGYLLWAAYRNHASSTTLSKAVTAVRSSTSVPAAPDDKSLRDAQNAIMFSIAPLTSLSAIMTPVDPDPVASFRQLIALPANTARGAPNIDPRRLRTMLDRGVVTFASATTDEDRARGASLIQTAALVGFPPARELLVRNFPQSEAIRSVVPANDVIRYGLANLMDGVASEDSKRVFLALGQHFASHGQLDLFATQLLTSLRGDLRPQLYHRLDTLLDLMEHVPGSCAALSRLLPGADDASKAECSLSLSERLRKHIETTKPAHEEEEAKRRGLFMLNQLGGR